MVRLARLAFALAIGQRFAVTRVRDAVTAARSTASPAAVSHSMVRLKRG